MRSRLSDGRIGRRNHLSSGTIDEVQCTPFSNAPADVAILLYHRIGSHLMYLVASRSAHLVLQQSGYLIYYRDTSCRVAIPRLDQTPEWSYKKVFSFTLLNFKFAFQATRHANEKISRSDDLEMRMRFFLRFDGSCRSIEGPQRTVYRMCISRYWRNRGSRNARIGGTRCRLFQVVLVALCRCRCFHESIHCVEYIGDNTASRSPFSSTWR